MSYIKTLNNIEISNVSGGNTAIGNKFDNFIDAYKIELGVGAVVVSTVAILYSLLCF